MDGKSKPPTIRRKKPKLEIYLKYKVKNLQKKAERYSRTPGFTREKLREVRKERRNLKRLHPTLIELLENRINICEKRKKEQAYSLKAKIVALKVLKFSEKYYTILSKVFGLPSRAVLTDFLNSIPVEPGICYPIFDNLKHGMWIMPLWNRICVLMFSEMTLRPNLKYSSKRDCVDGFVDNGEIRSEKVANMVQVFMLRGIQDDWKQVVGYNFSQGPVSSRDTVQYYRKIVKAAAKIGLIVIASVCDHRRTYCKSIEILLEESKTNALQRGLSPDEGIISIGKIAIVPLFDPPHLFKSIRNHLVHKDLRFPKNGKIMVAKWSYIYNAFFYDYKDYPNHLLCNFTLKHVVWQRMRKQSVRLCMQVFSHKLTGCIMLFSRLNCEYKEVKIKFGEESRETGFLCIFFDKLFDSINGRTTRTPQEIEDFVERKYLRRAVLNKKKSKHFHVWNEAIDTIKGMSFIPRKPKDTTRPVVLDKLIETIEGFMRIQKRLIRRNCSILPTRSFNQDPLENLFDHVKKNYDPPSSYEFTRILKTLFISNYKIPHYYYYNCENDLCRGFIYSIKKFIADGYDVVENFDDEAWEAPVLSDFFDMFKPLHSTDINNLSRWVGKQIFPIMYSTCTTCLDNFAHLGHSKKLCKVQKGITCISENFLNLLTSILNLSYFLLPMIIHESMVFANLKAFVLSHVQFDFKKCSHLFKIKSMIFGNFLKFIIYKYIDRVNNVISLRGTNLADVNLVDIANYSSGDYTKQIYVTQADVTSRLTFKDMFYRKHPRRYRSHY